MLLDTRAQAIGIARLFLGLGVGFVMVVVVNQVTGPLFTYAGREGSGEVANNGTAWMQELVGNLPLVFVLVSLFGLVAYSVFTRAVMS